MGIRITYRKPETDTESWVSYTKEDFLKTDSGMLHGTAKDLVQLDLLESMTIVLKGGVVVFEWDDLKETTPKQRK